jgi:hypothetical protein
MVIVSTPFSRAVRMSLLTVLSPQCEAGAPHSPAE